jgi:hypothetical protein
MHIQAQPECANHGKSRMVVMKCELCSSGERESEHRLCPPCGEAIARLSKIVNKEAEPATRELVKKQTAARTEPAPAIAVMLNYGWL